MTPNLRMGLIVVGGMFLVAWFFSDKSRRELTEKQEKLPGKYRLIHEDPAGVLLLIAIALISVGIFAN